MNFKNRQKQTATAGLSYVSWQLSRRGWNIALANPNERASVLSVSGADEAVSFEVQSRALSKRQAVPLGKQIETLRCQWWVITINVNSDEPLCFVMKREEVQTSASQDKDGGAFWLEPRDYDRAEYRNAWDRLDLAGAA